MTSGKVMEGVFAINKPTGLSSAQVLRDLQRHFTPSSTFQPYMEEAVANRDRDDMNQFGRLRKKKVEVKIGHGGTLDPLATGVLITGIGKGTKSLQNFLLCTKVYECVILFGTSTDTYDRLGKVLRRAPYEHVTKELVEQKLADFRGKFDQLPPLFSALKMNGKPLYEYAREGKPIPREIERRPVEVLELEMLEWMEGGTHHHEAPSEDADYAEINVATSLWKQEGILPGSVNGKGSEKDEADRRELFERRKRKMSDDQDELVYERPPSRKNRRTSSEEATMSGGLGDPEEIQKATVSKEIESKEGESMEAETKEGEPKENEAMEPNPEIKATIESSPTPKSPTTEAKTLEPEEKVKENKGPPAARLRMVVTSGFYVRSLCHDLGSIVSSAGLMAELKRTRQGEFELGDNVFEYSDLEKGESVWSEKVVSMLDDWNEKHANDPVREDNAQKKRGRDSHDSRNGSRDGWRGGNKRRRGGGGDRGRGRGGSGRRGGRDWDSSREDRGSNREAAD